MEDVKETEKLLSSKAKGEKWVVMALPVIVGVMKEIDGIDGKRKAEGEALRAALDEINERYRGPLEVLGAISEKIRERIKEEHQGTESVKEDGVGELIFPMKTTWEVTDIKAVPSEFKEVSTKLVNIAIKQGMAKIKGIVIGKKRGLEVRKEK